MSASAIRVECVYAGPGLSERRELSAAPGLTVADAIVRSGLAQWLADGGHPVAGYAVFGRKVTETDELADGDRLELLRPLLCPPRDARRKRARKGAGPVA